MIITEIKHLNVRISEFEDTFFDDNILPVFTTPLILKEVAARKKSKYKIETLNPDKKLTFRIVSFNEIVEELASRINKIAIDLEPHYFIDPSNPNSLPNEVRHILDKNKFKDEKKEIEEAILRIKKSTVRGKKLILYARPSGLPYRNARLRRRSKRIIKAMAGRASAASWVYNSHTGLHAVAGGLKYVLRSSSSHTHNKLFFPLIKKQDIFKYRGGAITNFKKFDLLIDNAFLPKIVEARSENTAATYDASVTHQGYGSSISAISSPTWLNPNTDIIKNKATLRSLQLKLRNIAPTPSVSENKVSTKSKSKRNEASLDLAFRQSRQAGKVKKLLFSGWIPTSKGALMLLDDEGWDLDLLLNKNIAGTAAQRLRKIRPYKLRKLRRLRRLRRLRLMSINLYLHRSRNVEKLQKAQEWQGRNNSKLNYGNKSCDYYPNKDSSHTFNPSTGRYNVNANKSLNNNYFIKHNDNKLNFIINWIGDNLANSKNLSTLPRVHGTNPHNLQYIVGELHPISSTTADRFIASAGSEAAAVETRAMRRTAERDMPIMRRSQSQRLNKKNISDIFLVQCSQAIQLPSLESRSEREELEPEKVKKQEAARLLTQGRRQHNNQFPAAVQSQRRDLASPSSLAPSLPAVPSRKERQQNVPFKMTRALTWADQPLKKNNNFLSKTSKENQKPYAGGRLSGKLNLLKLSTAKVKNHKFSTFASSITTISGIVNLDQIKVLSLYNGVGLAAALHTSSPACPLVPLQGQTTTVKGQQYFIENDHVLMLQGKNPVIKRYPLLCSNIALRSELFVWPWNSSNIVFLTQPRDAEATRHLKTIKSKVANWKKKKRLSAVLLHKTNLNYEKSLLWSRNLFLGEKFSNRMTKTKPGLASIFQLGARLLMQDPLYLPLVPGRTAPSGWQSGREQYSFFPHKSEEESRGYGRGHNLKKIRTSAKAWKKIATILNSRSHRASDAVYPLGSGQKVPSSSGLFWSIIKLYSSTFNPMLKSLNNKQLPGFLGKGTAQLKILKKVPGKDPLTPVATQVQGGDTSVFGLASVATSAAQLRLHPLSGSERTDAHLDIKNKISHKAVSRAKETGTSAMHNYAEPYKFNPFDPQIKNKVIKYLQPKVTEANKDHKLLRLRSSIAGFAPKGCAERSPNLVPSSAGYKELRTVTQAALSNSRGGVSVAALLDVNAALAPTAAPLAQGRSSSSSHRKNLNKFKVQRSIAAQHHAVRRADSKRFLFLYFIVPIFFATLKNSTLKNLDNQKKQLRSLIKLMLDSVPYHSSAAAVLRSSNKSQSLNSTPLRRIGLDPQRGDPGQKLAKDINYLMESLNLNIIKTMTPKNTTRFACAEATDLLKWSVLLIAQSLAPLKRKQDYYSLIFIKILETRGFLDLNKKAITRSATEINTDKAIGLSVTPAFKQRPLNFLPVARPPRAVRQGWEAQQTRSGSPLPPTAEQVFDGFAESSGQWHGLSQSAAQHSANIFSAASTKSAASADGGLPTTSLENQAVKTFYPGGRFISDWKRVTKVIWQEKYKFNVAYKRVKNSLNLANKSINIKFIDWYVIITIFRLWNIIKIKSFKYLSFFKLMVLFRKYPTFLSARVYRIKYLATASKSAFVSLSAAAVTASALQKGVLQRQRKKARKKSLKVYTGYAAKANTTLEPLNLLSKLALRKKAKLLRTKDVILRTAELFNSSSQEVNFIVKFKFTIINSILKVLGEIKQRQGAQLLLLERTLATASAAQHSNLRTLNQPNVFGGFAYAGQDRAFGLRSTATFIDNFSLWIWSQLPKSIYQHFVAGISPTSISYNLTHLVNEMDSRVPFIFTFSNLDPYKKLGFISKEITLYLDLQIDISTNRESREAYLKSTIYNEEISLSLRLRNVYLFGEEIRAQHRNATLHNSGYAAVPMTMCASLEIKQVADSLDLNIEEKENFNNLVNAKSTIIGKIRSIKLVELIDKIKEDIIIAEELAALVRVADITDLNLINKKIFRRINASKYLNKKNIYRSNRIKILQTIETIKTDFRFEPKLDSNSLSNIPVSLLFYSNLIPENSAQHFTSQELPVSTTASTLSLAATAAGKEAVLQPHQALWPAEAQRNRPEAEKHPVISAYLRELSIYNRETKGIIKYFSKIIAYNFNTNSNKISSTINDLLEASFKAMRCLISKPVFVITPDKITIELFYFLLITNKNNLNKIKGKYYNNHTLTRKTYTKFRLKETVSLNSFSLSELFPEHFELLCGRLNKVFNKPVELNLIRLHYPSGDTNILVNLMGIIINKVRLNYIFRKLFRGSIIKTLTKVKAHKYNDISIIPAFLTGLNIKVAGRIMTQKIKPRKTIKLKRRGATARGKINYLNFARLTNKNKRGSYSITISAGQNFFK